MTTLLDHLIVFCSEGAPEAEALVRLGLTEGPSNTHPGQGTSNRRFFFGNAFLELVYVHDATEAQDDSVRRLTLWDRWSGRVTACPFGVVLRGATAADIKAPFPSWSYKPPYFPAGVAIDVGQDIPLTEPMFFHFAFSPSRPTSPTGAATDHALGVGSITSVAIDVVSPDPLTSADAVKSCAILSMQQAERPLMTLTFDDARRGASADLRPTLPLVLKW